MKTSTQTLTTANPRLEILLDGERIGSCQYISGDGSIQVSVSNQLSGDNIADAVGLSGSAVAAQTEAGIVYFRLANARLIVELESGAEAVVAVGIA